MTTEKEIAPYTLDLAGRWEKRIEITILDGAYSIQGIVDLIQTSKAKFNPLEQMPTRNSHWTGEVKVGGTVVATYAIQEVDGEFDEVESACDPNDNEVEVQF